MKSLHRIALLGIAISWMPHWSSASTTMEIVTDNDFALFVGNSTSINRLIYQNNVEWGSQIADLASFSFDLQAGETTFYLLAMGGGGEENISGQINGVNLTSIPVLQSSNVEFYLSDYNTSAVTDGSYMASLADVQVALANVIWFSPTITTSQTVVSQSGFGSGYTFDDSTAVLYQFTAESVNVESVPEPSTAGLTALAGGGVFLASWLRRRSLAR